MPNADRPSEVDLLERGPLVEQLAHWALKAPMSDGFVIGVTGPWGSGKTTVLRLLERRLDDMATVIWFEPWLFSKADDLVTRFFDEVASELASENSKSLRKIAKGMAAFGDVLSPAASVMLGPAGQLIAAPKRLADLKRSSVASQRRELRDALLRSGKRIVVIIDDIDRLDPREIAEVMRLVKLVADLPGVVHILGYERTQVERALSHPNVKGGRAYLEKIVQASVTVPPIARDRLRTMSMEWLEHAVGERALEGWETETWAKLLIGGIDGYLRTMRDGYRLANMAPAALEMCSGEVAGMDVIALEAMRIFDPDLHEKLPDLIDALLGTTNVIEAALSADKLDAGYRACLTAALDASAKPDTAQHLLRTLFPAAAHLLGGGSRRTPDGRWRTAKRVAARSVFMRYLYLVLPSDEVASSIVDDVVAAFASGDELQSALDGVEDSRVSDLLDRARARLSEQPEPDVFGCSMVLLSLTSRVRRGSGFLDVDPADRMRWFVEDLVGTVESRDERYEVASELVAKAPTLSLRLDMLYAFSSGPNASRKPQVDVFENASYGRLAREIASEVKASSGEALATETGVLWLLQLTYESLGPAVVLAKCKELPVLRAVLQTTGTEVRPRASHGVALHLEPLMSIAGVGVLDVLGALAEDDTALQPDVRAALQNELAKQPRTEPPEAPSPTG
ncbi:MAG: P-loop NTPase fold protein [Solirubrobacteraceae bacterium]